MSRPSGEPGELRNQETPAIRLIVPPDCDGRLSEDDPDPGDIVFDAALTPMLVYGHHGEHGPGCVLWFDGDAEGNVDDHFIPGTPDDAETALASARAWLRRTPRYGGEAP